MAPIDAVYVTRKENAIAEDMKTAFAGYERLTRHVDTIRTWTVSIQVAALGFLIAGRLSPPTAAVFPAGLALAAFLALELRARSSMRFNKSYVLACEQIQMIVNADEYATAVTEHELRDLRLVRIDRATKLSHLAASLFDLNVAVWYGVWVALLILAWWHYAP